MISLSYFGVGVRAPFGAVGVVKGSTITTPEDSPTKNLTPPPILTTKNNSHLAPAGNLARYFGNWKNITNDSFVLNIIKHGYKLQLSSSKFYIKNTTTFPSNKNKSAICQEVSELLNSSAISKIDPLPSDTVSRIFLVPKKNGKKRLILDLSNLNNFLIKTSFKMEDKSTISSLIERNDFLVSLDLKDAFHSIPLNPLYRRFTSFEVFGQRFCYNCLPFGLSSSPRIFSKVLKPVISFLRNKGIKITFYLDDILICADTAPKVLSHLSDAISLLCDLGFSINYSKSSLIPSQTLVHLGYL